MKKIFTLVLLLLGCLIGQSQLQKGNLMLGGTVSFNTQKNTNGFEDNVKQTFIGLHPSIGKFYRDNRVVGVNLSFSSRKNADDSYLYDTYGVGLFLRQYLPLGRSFNLFAEEGANFSRLKTEQDQPYQLYRSKLVQNALTVNFYPGIAYAITPKFQVELSLNDLLTIGYSHEKKHNIYTDGTPDKHITGNSFYFNTGLPGTNVGSLGFGLRWIL